MRSGVSSTPARVLPACRGRGDEARGHRRRTGGVDVALEHQHVASVLARRERGDEAAGTGADDHDGKAEVELRAIVADDGHRQVRPQGAAGIARAPGRRRCRRRRSPRRAGSVVFTRPVSSLPLERRVALLRGRVRGAHDEATRPGRPARCRRRSRAPGRPCASARSAAPGCGTAARRCGRSDRPRRRPSLSTPESRYSVPPKPDFASQMLPGSCADHFCSAEQQAWSLTIQSTSPASTASHSASTSSRGRIGGLTFACTAHSQSTSSSRWPTVTSRRKSMCGNTSRIFSAASIALREVRCSRLMLRQSVSWAR